MVAGYSGGVLCTSPLLLFCGDLLTTGERTAAFSEPNYTFGLHCYRFVLHRQLRALEVLSMTGMVLAVDRNYGIFKYTRIKKVAWCLPSDHQNILPAINECAIRLCFYQMSFAYFKMQLEKM